MAQAGPRAATLLHRAADLDQQGWENTMKVEHGGIADALAGYVEMARHFEPAAARYLQNHRGHFVFVKPEERRFVTAELIRRTSLHRHRAGVEAAGSGAARGRPDQLVIPITPGERNAPSTTGRASRTRSPDPGALKQCRPTLIAPRSVRFQVVRLLLSNCSAFAGPSASTHCFAAQST